MSGSDMTDGTLCKGFSEEPLAAHLSRSPPRDPGPGFANHISVCICTFKRPHFLKRLLDHVAEQHTGEHYTYSIVVVDNDSQRSGEAVCNDFVRRHAQPPLTYCVQPT